MLRWATAGSQLSGVLLADVDDVTSVDGVLQDLHGAAEEEVGVGVGSVALDEGVVAGRHGLEHGPALHAPDLDVVECQEEDAGVLDEPVVGHDGDALVERGGHRGHDGDVVLGPG